MQATIKRLADARASAWEQAKALLDAAEAESRDLTTDEESTWTRLNAEIDIADQRIAELVEVEEREAKAAEARARFEAVVRPTGDASPEARELEDATRKALIDFFSGRGSRAIEVSPNGVYDAIERRDLVKGTASAGGNTVSTSFRNQVIEHLVDTSSIRQTNVTVLTTDAGEAIQVPKTTSHGSAAWVSEGAAIPESDPAFGQVTLNAWKAGDLIQVSTELLTDTGFDLLGYVARQAGRALGLLTDAAYVAGDGSSKPTGIITQTTLGKTAASATAIAADELIDLYFSVIGPYRQNGYWLLNDTTMAAARKLKDTTNQYLWAPGLVAGAPDTLLGRPVKTDPNMPAIATGNKTVVFGDFSAYVIRDVRGIRFERSDDFAFNADLVTFRAILRTDGKLADTTGAVKHLIQA